MSSVAIYLAKKALAKGASVAGWPFAVATTATEVVYKCVEEHEKSVCEMARRRLGCNHLDVCPKGWGTRVSDIVDTAMDKRGCAFYYNGVALWHFQANLDVTKLDVRPLRYHASDRKVGYYDMATEPCRSCNQ